MTTQKCETINQSTTRVKAISLLQFSVHAYSALTPRMPTDKGAKQIPYQILELPVINLHAFISHWLQLSLTI